MTLSLEVTLPARVHVYAPGVQGYKPVALNLTARGFQRDGAVFPPSKMLNLAVIHETVPVYQGKNAHPPRKPSRSQTAAIRVNPRLSTILTERRLQPVADLRQQVGKRTSGAVLSQAGQPTGVGRFGADSRGNVARSIQIEKQAQSRANTSGNDALAYSIENELRNAVDIELPEDVAAVRFDGGQTDIQQVCDFLIGAPLGNQL